MLINQSSVNQFLILIILFNLVSCNNNDQPNSNGEPTQATVITPQPLSYSIINVYPHDTGSFTQGLAFYKGELYEGTGEKGRSKLMKVDLKTGKAIQSVKLDDKYFGEGIAILNDTIYQLTWQEKTVFAYSLKDLKKLTEFPINTEGWGLTHDGQRLIATDGSSNLYFYEPGTFRLLMTLSVTDAGSLAYNLNELEYINGYIYANQWEMPFILKIDPATGVVVAKANLTEVWNRIKLLDPSANVPNGIAYDETTQKIYVTGKRWPELYEIQFGQ